MGVVLTGVAKLVWAVAGLKPGFRKTVLFCLARLNSHCFSGYIAQPSRFV